MRSYLSFFAIFTALAATNCVIQEADDDDKDAGAGGSGTGGSGATGGSSSNPCGSYTTAGECVDDSTIKACFVSEEYGVEPQLITTNCTSEEKCEVVNGTATCKLQGACYNGTTACTRGWSRAAAPKSASSIPKKVRFAFPTPEARGSA